MEFVATGNQPGVSEKRAAVQFFDRSLLQAVSSDTTATDQGHI